MTTTSGYLLTSRGPQPTCSSKASEVGNLSTCWPKCERSVICLCVNSRDNYVLCLLLLSLEWKRKKRTRGGVWKIFLLVWRFYWDFFLLDFGKLSIWTFSLAHTFYWDLSICISFHWDFLIWVDCNFEIVGAMFVMGSTSVTKQQMRDAGSFVISRLTNDRWARTGVAWTPTLRSWFSHKQTANRQTDR